MANDLESKLSSKRVCILGAGIIGSSLAIGLARLGYRVLVVERNTPRSGPSSFGIDVRSIAITPASKDFLTSLDLWNETIAVPYRSMSIWEDQGVANLDFDCEEIDQTCLGWIVEAKKFQVGVWEKLNQEGVSKITDSPVALSVKEEAIELSFNDKTLTFDFLVGADGADSFVRTQLAIPLKKVSSGHYALASILKSDLEHDGVALQKFLDSGPIAALPSTSAKVRTIIWSQTAELAKHRLQLSEEEFGDLVERTLGHRIGKIEKVGKRFIFPLLQQRVESFAPKKNVVILGDAARSIHPLAGFGANIGLEDVRSLLKIASEKGLNNESAIQRYSIRRQIRSDFVIYLLEGILRAYTNVGPRFSWLRNIAIDFVNKKAWIKKQIAREASGYGPISRF